MLSKEFDQGINCAGKLVYWVARFSYLLVLKRRFSNLLYLDLELFSIFEERNRILYTNGVFIKNLPNFFRFLVFLPSSRIKAFECAFLLWNVVQERPWVFAPCTLFKILRQEDGVCCLVIFIRVEIQWPSKQVGEGFFCVVLMLSRWFWTAQVLTIALPSTCHVSKDWNEEEN